MRMRTSSADPRGNERLTAMTGAVLLVLFTAECLTLLDLGNLLTLHIFLGMLLIGPVSLKIGSTLWRFTRYYTGSEPYVRKGPPAPLQRMLGPLVILTSVAVIGTGAATAFSTNPWSWDQLHHEAFLLWLVVMIVHLASYLPRLPRLLSGRQAGQARGVLSASLTRWLLLCGSLVAGLGLALLTYHVSGRFGALAGM
jgi:hypothetical protein